eukprot:5797167-Prymnesium_polylepis.2
MLDDPEAMDNSIREAQEALSTMGGTAQFADPNQPGTPAALLATLWTTLPTQSCRPGPPPASSAILPSCSRDAVAACPTPGRPRGHAGEDGGDAGRRRRRR